MGTPHDTDPVPSPVESVSELPIQSGDAQHSMIAALDRLTAAFVNVEKVAMALARLVDQQGRKP